MAAVFADQGLRQTASSLSCHKIPD
jgi:hypothetical protein